MRALLLSLLLLSTPSLAGEVSFSSLGVTYHGVVVNEELADHMPHKITDDGKWVFHPTDFAFNYRSSNSFHLNLTYLRDCFDQQAMVVAAGNHWRFWRLGLGYLLGVYAREKFVFTDRSGREASPADFLYAYENNGIQYMPMAFATASIRLKAIEPYVDLLFGGNWFLNHLELGVGFGW